MLHGARHSYIFIIINNNFNSWEQAEEAIILLSLEF